VYAAVEGAKTTRGECPQKKQERCRMQGSFGVQLRKRGKVSSCRNSFGSGMVIPKRKCEAKREKQRQGVQVSRESAGSVFERAVVMTLKRAEVTREERDFPVCSAVGFLSNDTLNSVGASVPLTAERMRSKTSLKKLVRGAVQSS